MSMPIAIDTEPPHHKLVRELVSACNADDLPRIRHILTKTPLIAIDLDPPHHKLVRELVSACDADDLPRIRHLLTTTSLEKAHATDVLKNTYSLPVTRCLLEQGADADYKPTWRPETNHESLERLKLFAEFGYDVKLKGHLILQDFAHFREALDWILDQGADINDSNHGQTDTGFRLAGKDYSVKVLSKVAATGDIELFDHLVSRGADPHRSYSLHSVSRCKDPEKSKAMIDHLLDVHHMNIEADDYDLRDIMYYPSGGTPLHSAAYEGNLTTLAHLLKRGANPESAMGTALGISFREGSKLPVLALLLDAGANADGALDEAVEKNLVDAAEMCLAHGADPTQSIEILRARDARVQARRGPGWVDNFEHRGDFHSSKDNDEESHLRARMEALLRAAEESQKPPAKEFPRER